MLGREVATLANGERAAGVHHVMFNAINLPSGAYFYALKAGYFSVDEEHDAGEVSIVHAKLSLQRGSAMRNPVAVSGTNQHFDPLEQTMPRLFIATRTPHRPSFRP